MPENSGNGLEDTANKIISKEAVASTVMAWLYKRIRDWEGKLNKIEDDLNQRVNQTIIYYDKVKKDDLRLKVKKAKKKLRSENDDNTKKLTKRLKLKM